MFTVTFIDFDGTSHDVPAPADPPLIQTAPHSGVTGILGDCGGPCSCATCHGYVDPQWAGELPPVSETEAFMHEGVPEPRDTSRLCCQIKMRAALDGLVVRLPAEQV